VIQGQALAELGDGLLELVCFEEIACFILHFLSLQEVLPCLLELRIVRVLVESLSEMLPPHISVPIVCEQQASPVEEVGVVDELVLDEGGEFDGLRQSVQLDEDLYLLSNKVNGVGAVSDEVIEVVQCFLVLRVVHCLSHILLILYQLYSSC
jgi:hypothetical protein